MQESQNNKRELDLNAAELLLDEWKWRHQHCWRFISRWGLSALTVALLPYVSVFHDGFTFLRGLGRAVFLFPLASIALAQVAIWLFAAEYVRCRPVEAMYNKALGRYSANVSAKMVTDKMVRGVAQLTILVVGSCSVLLYLLNILFLFRINNFPVRSGLNLTFVIGSIVLGVFLIGADLKLARISSREVSRRIKEQQLTDDSVH